MIFNLTLLRGFRLTRRKLATWGKTVNSRQTDENLLQYSEAKQR